MVRITADVVRRHFLLHSRVIRTVGAGTLWSRGAKTNRCKRCTFRPVAKVVHWDTGLLLLAGHDRGSEEQEQCSHCGQEHAVHGYLEKKRKLKRVKNDNNLCLAKFKNSELWNFWTFLFGDTDNTESDLHAVPQERRHKSNLFRINLQTDVLPTGSTSHNTDFMVVEWVAPSCMLANSAECRFLHFHFLRFYNMSFLSHPNWFQHILWKCMFSPNIVKISAWKKKRFYEWK